MSYLEEIEKVKSSDLTPEEKKRAIRKIRRQARKARGFVPAVKTEPSVPPEEKLQELISASQLPEGDLSESHYFFSVHHCSAENIPFQTLLEKYQKKFVISPRDYVVHSQGRSLMFGLGPIPKS